jgi:hypothetical protein
LNSLIWPRCLLILAFSFTMTAKSNIDLSALLTLLSDLINMRSQFFSPPDAPIPLTRVEFDNLWSYMNNIYTLSKQHAFINNRRRAVYYKSITAGFSARRTLHLLMLQSGKEIEAVIQFTRLNLRQIVRFLRLLMTSILVWRMFIMQAKSGLLLVKIYDYMKQNSSEKFNEMTQ